MFSIVFSKSALLFFLFVLLTELLTKFGLKETAIKGNSVYALPIADLCGVCSFLFLVFYSYETVWWASLVLLAGYLLIYQLVKLLVTLALIKKQYIYVVNGASKYLIIPVAILMFVLVNR